MADPQIVGLIRDPDFISMSPADQRSTLSRATGDDTFKSLSDGETLMWLNKARNSQPTQFEQQRPGATMSTGQHALDFLKTTAQNLVPSGGAPTPYATMGAVSPAPFQKMQQDEAQALTQQRQFRKEAGYNPAYRALAEIAPLAMVNPAGAEQAAAQARTGGVLGNTVGPPAAIAAANAAIPALLDKIPSKARAGANFNTVKAAVGDNPIDVRTTGNIALDIQDLAQRGGSMPKVVRDFIKRATDPEQGPLTYSEARDFYSNATRLSANETQRLTPAMQMQLGRFTRALGQSIGETAEAGGVGQQYRAGMKEYGAAAKMSNRAEMVKELAKKSIPYVAAGYAGKKLIEGK